MDTSANTITTMGIISNESREMWVRRNKGHRYTIYIINQDIMHFDNKINISNSLHVRACKNLYI